mgnify:CR=1 FL=1
MLNRDEDTVLAKTGSGALYLKRREILKVFKAKVLDNFKKLSFLFWCQTYHRCARFRKPARIDPFIFGPDPGLLGLQGKSDTKSMKTKKKAYKII